MLTLNLNIFFCICTIAFFTSAVVITAQVLNKYILCHCQSISSELIDLCFIQFINLWFLTKY